MTDSRTDATVPADPPAAQPATAPAATSPAPTGTAPAAERPVATDHTHAVRNGKRELTIDELAETQPGLDRLMAELGPRMHRLYYAAGARNWRLAEYYLQSVIKQLKLCGFSRPKYAEPIATYVAEDCEPVRATLRQQDPAAFEVAYQRMVDQANRYHADYNKSFIVWRTPAQPPEDLDLTAGLES